MKQEIRYLRRAEIDEQKWNRCLQHAANGLCYSHSEYLDELSPDWSALVLNDYEAVMPLPWRKKYGISYIYQPTFCQQTGITTNGKQDDLSNLFLSNIPGKFKYCHLQLNAANCPTDFPYHLRKNFLLTIGAEASVIRDAYDRNAHRNIRKAQESGVTIVDSVPPEEIIRLHLTRFHNPAPPYRSDLDGLRRLLDKWLASARVKTYGALNNSGSLIASSAYVLYKNRITFILNGNSTESLSVGATHLLKDHALCAHAGTGCIMDFEGSDDADFARFYSQFGASAGEHYPHIELNKLPWALRWLKRGGTA